MNFILAPLRGVTIRCFRETFAAELRAAGFVEAVTPFIAAMPGVDPLGDRELKSTTAHCSLPTAHCSLPTVHCSLFTVHCSLLPVTPQFITKDPGAFRDCLLRVRDAGYATADLNCGCPFPMVRNKGRGSGLLRTPGVLRRLLEVGCETMGPGKFSVKTRLGVERPDELLGLMPLFNEFPLRFLAVHARTAKQMYEGRCDAAAFARVAAAARVPVVPNGDLTLAAAPDGAMIGRDFVRSLGARPDAAELLSRYVAASEAELCGDRPVLGRVKELVSYWKDLPVWRRRWDVLKLCRSLAELRLLGLAPSCPPDRIVP